MGLGGSAARRLRAIGGSLAAAPAMPTRVEDYEVLHTIGTGSYGRCQKIRRKSDGKVSAALPVPVPAAVSPAAGDVSLHGASRGVGPRLYVGISVLFSFSSTSFLVFLPWPARGLPLLTAS